MYALWFNIGLLTGASPTGSIVPIIGLGDGDYPKHRGVKPIVRIRPKAERELDDVLEIVETISEGNRVTENKKAVKTALAAVKTIEVQDVYAAPLASITKALAKVARNAAKHEGIQAAASKIATEIDNLVASMEARRKRQRREEEELILWLSSSINSPLRLRE